MIKIRSAYQPDVKILLTLRAGDEDYMGRSVAERDVFIASYDGRDVGFVMLNWRPLYNLYRKLDIPEIQDLFVIDDARRKGVGAAMIAHCENLIRDDDHTHAGISVGLHAGFGAAQHLYARMGYIPDGYGVTYDRQPVKAGEMRAVDDNLCLMLVKAL